MKSIEIFENLMEPLRLELGNDSWEFLMKRGQMFIDQIQPSSVDAGKKEVCNNFHCDPFINEWKCLNCGKILSEHKVKSDQPESGKSEEATYNVSRYFDDHIEAVIARGLTKDEAKLRANGLNDMKPRAYVEYVVRKD